MSDIPDDIVKAAASAIHAPNADIHGNTLRYFLDERYVDMATRVIARAILAEREKCRQLLSEAEKREKEAKTGWAFAEGDLVRKKTGSWWEGRVVGTYTTEQTPRGYAVQLDKPFGPVQIYPENALEHAAAPAKQEGGE